MLDYHTDNILEQKKLCILTFGNFYHFFYTASVSVKRIVFYMVGQKLSFLPTKRTKFLYSSTVAKWRK
jgi:hypothetical protein